MAFTSDDGNPLISLCEKLRLQSNFKRQCGLGQENPNAKAAEFDDPWTAMLQLGRCQPMCIWTESFPNFGEPMLPQEKMEVRPQITIQCVRLASELQRKGYFNALVTHLFDTLPITAVQIEAVGNQEWSSHMMEPGSPWISQTPREHSQFNMNFACLKETWIKHVGK